MSKEQKSESLSLGTMSAADPKSFKDTLCVFGTGDLGRSLGQRLLQSGYTVVYGSRRPDSCGPIPQGAQVMSHADAALSARLIFICVHRDHYGFLENLAPNLEGKVLVDLSNNLKKDMYPDSNAEYLQRLVPGAAVVKGLNTLSAWALQNELLTEKQAYVCGDSAEAKQAVSQVCTRLGLSVLDRGSLRASRELEDFPLQLFSTWRLPLGIAFGLTAGFFIYLVIRDVVYTYVKNGEDKSYNILITLPNKVAPAVALIMLSLCYLPGAIAGFIQLYRGTKYRRFPNWLDRWMLCRKQIGLLALGYGLLHAMYIFIISLRYSFRRGLIGQTLGEASSNVTVEFDNTSAWRDDAIYASGILGLFLFVLLGLTSLPSVGATLSWREFSFVQSKLGYLTLLLCTAHAYFYGWDKFLNVSTYKWYTPPVFMLTLIIPSIVLVLKVILLLLDRPLTRIRQGWERSPQQLKGTNF